MVDKVGGTRGRRNKQRKKKKRDGLMIDNNKNGFELRKGKVGRDLMSWIRRK